MDAAQIQHIESGVERGASALFGAAVAYAAYGLLGAFGIQPALGAFAAVAGALAYFSCTRMLGAAARGAPFQLPPFELQSLDEFEGPDELLLMESDRICEPEELLLTDADRLMAHDELVLTDADRLDGSHPLLLDDILAAIGSDSRVVRLFDRQAMPTPGQLHTRIATHSERASPAEAPADAAQALSAALAELRRSLG